MTEALLARLTQRTRRPSGRILMLGSAWVWLALASVGEAQLPSRVDLAAPPGAESSPVLRVYGEDAEDLLGGDDHVGTAGGTGAGGGIAFGDVNGDGRDDLIVGAPAADPMGRDTAGEVYIIFGKASLAGTQVNLDREGAAGDPGLTRIAGAQASQVTGRAVACGDVDGDGLDDVILGAPSDGRNDPGRVWVVYGASITPGTVVDLADTSGMDPVPTLIEGTLDAQSAAPGGLSPFVGQAVACADLDADGLDDVIIGANFADAPGGINAGAVYVVFGRTDHPATPLTVGGAPGAGFARVLGEDEQDQFGAALEAGDINGDGFADIVAGAPAADTPGGVNAGKVYVIFGFQEFGKDPDEDNTIDLSLPDPPALPVITRILGDDGSEFGDYLGHSIATGDVNGDGYDDIVAGAQWASPSTAPRAGEVYVFYGNNTTLPGSTVNLHVKPSGTVSAAGETRLLGVRPGAQTGFSVGAGDVDGDGRADVVIGALEFMAIGSETGPGHIYVVYGGSLPAATAVSLSAVPGKIQVEGARKADRFGTSVRAGGDLNGDGFGDVAGSAQNGENPLLDDGGSNKNTGYVAVLFGAGTAATASATEAFVADVAPRTGMGGRLSPTLRTWLMPLDGAASTASVVLTRGDASIENLGDSPVDVADVLWYLNNNRNAEVTLRYTDLEISGLSESDLVLYRAASPAGPWTAMGPPDATFDPGRNEVRFAAATPSYYALAAITAAPALSIGAPSPSQTRTGPVSYTVTYVRATRITLSEEDVELHATGTATATVAVSPGPTDDTRIVTLSSITGDGTLGISIAPGTAEGAGQTLALGAGPSATVRVDNTPPTVEIGPPSVTLTSGGPVTYEVLFQGTSVIELAPEDVVLHSTGTANATVGVSAGSTVDGRIVTLSDITGDGTLAISIAAGAAEDEAGNATPATDVSLPFEVDNTPPTVAIEGPSSATAGDEPVTYQVVYTGAAVVSLTAEDVTLTATGSASAQVAVTGSGVGSRTVTLSNFSGTGTLAISIVAGTATDPAGNEAPAAGPSAVVNVAVGPVNFPDVNEDGLLNALDVQTVINGALGKSTQPYNADVNRDGLINALDVQIVINAVLGRNFR